MGSNVISPRTEKELLKQNKLFKNQDNIGRMPGVMDLQEGGFNLLDQPDL